LPQSSSGFPSTPLDVFSPAICDSIFVLLRNSNHFILPLHPPTLPALCFYCVIDKILRISTRNFSSSTGAQPIFLPLQCCSLQLLYF
jgi:hypothetical protein